MMRAPGGISKSGKFLVYGESGSGKSYFGLTFPGVVAIDSEIGLVHYEDRDIELDNGNKYNNLLLIDNTASIEDLEDDLVNFEDSAAKVNAKTLLIDSETKFFDTLQIICNQAEERRIKKRGYSDKDVDSVLSQRSWGRIKMNTARLQSLKLDIAMKGYHIVSIAHETYEYETDGSKSKIIGMKSDVHRNLAYDYDITLYMYTKRVNGKTKHFARVEKDKTGVTRAGDEIENPCYDIWADYFNSSSELTAPSSNYVLNPNNSGTRIDKELDAVDSYITEWKEVMQIINASKNTAALSEITKYIKEKGIDVAALPECASSVVEELLLFTKKFLS